MDEPQVDAVVALLELCGAQSVSIAPLLVADGACSQVSALFGGTAGESTGKS